MSARTRDRYTYVQQGLEAIGKHTPDPQDRVTAGVYDDMYKISSRFRSALTNDLESRRKRSIIWTVLDVREDCKVRREMAGRLRRLQEKQVPQSPAIVAVDADTVPG